MRIARVVRYPGYVWLVLRGGKEKFLPDWKVTKDIWDFLEYFGG